MTFEEIKRRYVADEMTPAELKALRWNKVISVPQYADIRIAAANAGSRKRPVRQPKLSKTQRRELENERRRHTIREIKIALNSMFGSRAHRWGLTIPELQAMIQGQDYKCAICLDPFHPQHRRPEIDHCHRKGKIRGLLCRDCNLGLGYFKDRVQSLDAAIGYLIGATAPRPNLPTAVRQRAWSRREPCAPPPTPEPWLGS